MVLSGEPTVSQQRASGEPTQLVVTIERHSNVINKAIGDIVRLIDVTIGVCSPKLFLTISHC